ncbi:hypothetical protein D9M72_386330 [compost metagenome]
MREAQRRGNTDSRADGRRSAKNGDRSRKQCHRGDSGRRQQQPGCHAGAVMEPALVTQAADPGLGGSGRECQHADRGNGRHRVQAVPRCQRREETDGCAQGPGGCRKNERRHEEAPMGYLAGKIQQRVARAGQRGQLRQRHHRPHRSSRREDGQGGKEKGEAAQEHQAGTDQRARDVAQAFPRAVAAEIRSCVAAGKPGHHRRGRRGKRRGGGALADPGEPDHQGVGAPQSDQRHQRKREKPCHDHRLCADAVAQSSEDRFQHHLGEVVNSQEDAQIEQAQADITAVGAHPGCDAVGTKGCDKACGVQWRGDGCGRRGDWRCGHGIAPGMRPAPLFA